MLKTCAIVLALGLPSLAFAEAKTFAVEGGQATASVGLTVQVK